MGDKPFELIVTYPKFIIFAIIILTACFCFGLAGITSDPDFDKFLPEDHPARVYNDTVKNTFSLGKSVFVVIDTDNPNGVFNRKSLHIIHALTDEVAAIDGVLENTIMSIATERNIVGTEEGMTADYFMEDLPESDEEIARLKQDLLASDLHVGSIISPDGSMASIVFDVEDDIDNLLLHDTLQELLSSYRDQENNIIVTGDPVASGLVGKYIGIDMGVMMPLAILVVLIILWITFRDYKAMLLPFFVISITVLWTLGLYGITGMAMSMISPVVPIILMAIGDTDSIHIISVYYRKMVETNGADRKKSLVNTLKDVMKPVVLTSITTCIGFLSLLSSPIEQIRQFGIFCAFGVLAAMVLSILLIPSLIVLWKMDAPAHFLRNYEKAQRQSGMETVLAKWGFIIGSRKKTILALLCVVLAVSLVGMNRIVVDDILIENFKKKTEIYQATKLANKNFNGTSLLNFVLEPLETRDEDGFFQRPENLNAVEDLQLWAENNSDLVGDTLAITDFLKKIRTAMNNNDPVFRSIPPTEEEAAQYLFLYGLSGKPEDFDKYVTPDYSKLNVFVYMKEPPYRDSRLFVDGLYEHFTAKGYDRTMTLQLAGQGSLGMARVAVVIDTLWNSLSYSLILILVVCTLMFRSIAAGLLTVFTVAISLIINFGVMGLLGIDIAVGTSIISAIIIGIGVDFAIHVLSKYMLIMKSEQSLLKATETLMGTLGVTLFISVIVIVFGFMVLLASQLPPTVTVGALVSLAMLSSFVASLVFLPIAILVVKPSFISRYKKEK